MHWLAITTLKLSISSIVSADAKSQFAECYKITTDLKMKANCYDALKALATEGVSPSMLHFPYCG
jgi:hypothetical protein